LYEYYRHVETRCIAFRHWHCVGALQVVKMRQQLFTCHFGMFLLRHIPNVACKPAFALRRVLNERCKPVFSVRQQRLQACKPTFPMQTLRLQATFGMCRNKNMPK